MKKFKAFLILITTPVITKSWMTNALYAIPRIVAGLILALDFGASKFGMPWSGSDSELSLFEVASWFPEDVAKFGFPFSLSPVLFAWLGAASEAIGGIFLAFGLGTRFWAFLIGMTMITAIFFEKWPDVIEQGTWPILPALGFLWVSVYCIIFGSGKLGIDYLIARKYK